MGLAYRENLKRAELHHRDLLPPPTPLSPSAFEQARGHNRIVSLCGLISIMTMFNELKIRLRLSCIFTGDEVPHPLLQGIRKKNNDFCDDATGRILPMFQMCLLPPQSGKNLTSIYS